MACSIGLSQELQSLLQIPLYPMSCQIDRAKVEQAVHIARGGGNLKVAAGSVMILRNLNAVVGHDAEGIVGVRKPFSSGLRVCQLHRASDILL